MTLGEKLGKLRKEKKLSQKEIASKLGVHLNTYSRIERDINNANPKTIEKLAEIFDCEKAYLAEGNSAAPAKKTSEVKKFSAKKGTKTAPAKKEAKDEPAKEAAKEAEKPVAAVVEKETKAAEKKPAAGKKTSTKRGRSGAKKSTAKKEPVKTETKPAPQATTDTAEINIELQYAGKSIAYTELIDRAKEISGSDGTGLNIYIKPEENRVYFVVNGQPGSFEI